MIKSVLRLYVITFKGFLTEPTDNLVDFGIMHTIISLASVSHLILVVIATNKSRRGLSAHSLSQTTPKFKPNRILYVAVNKFSAMSA